MQITTHDTSGNPGEPDDDDFLDDDDIEFDDEEFDGFDTGGGSSGGGSWKNSTAVKIGAVVAVLVGLFFGVSLLGGSEPPAPSRTPAAPEVTEAPGGEVSPVIEEALRQKNQQTRELAEQTGGSAIPVPIGPPRSTNTVQRNQTEDQDPLARWRQIQQQRLQEQKKIREQQQEQNALQTALQSQRLGQQRARIESDDKAVNQLAEAMQAQMQQIFGAGQISGTQQLVITDANSFFAQQQNAGFQNNGQNFQGNFQNANQDSFFDTPPEPPPAPPEILVPAGTIEYGELILEANTDAPGPVLARIATGPLRGSRIIGSFDTQEDFLTLQFSQVVINGRSINIQAIAINPETSNPGIVTEIDRRYFSRIILPTAAAFIQGFGEAVADTGRTRVTVDGGAAVEDEDDLDTREEFFSAIENAGGELSELFEEESDRVEPLLRVAAGTPIAIFFLAPVIDSPDQLSGFGGGFGNGAGGGFNGLPAGLDPSILQNPNALAALGLDPNTVAALLGSGQVLAGPQFGTANAQAQPNSGLQAPFPQFVNPFVVNPTLTGNGVSNNQ